MSLAAFCTFFPALEAAAFASAAAVAAFFDTASFAARAAVLASRGDDEPAGVTAAEARAGAEEGPGAPALGVVAAERSAGVDARDERGVKDFFRDSPSFLERVRFSSTRAAAVSDILKLRVEEEAGKGGGGAGEKERVEKESVCFFVTFFF